MSVALEAMALRWCKKGDRARRHTDTVKSLITVLEEAFSMGEAWGMQTTTPTPLAPRPDNALTEMPAPPSEVSMAVRLARFEAFGEAAAIASDMIGPPDDGEDTMRERISEVAHHIEQGILELRSAAKPLVPEPADVERDAVVAFLVNRSEWLKRELRNGGTCHIEEQQARAIADMIQKNRHRGVRRTQSGRVE